MDRAGIAEVHEIRKLAGRWSAGSKWIDPVAKEPPFLGSIPSPMGAVSSRPRVLVVDDEPRTLEGLRTLLRAAGINVVATAADGDDAWHKVDQFDIDVVVMDIRMPRMDGIAATRQIRLERAATKVILFTAYDSSFEQVSARDAGAAGYLVKTRDEARLPQSVRGAWEQTSAA